MSRKLVHIKLHTSSLPAGKHEGESPQLTLAESEAMYGSQGPTGSRKEAEAHDEEWGSAVGNTSLQF